ncbi:hypothetical protein BCR44DRAFT_311306 [Catenaria anguillulae PL171]|uniref:Uncharacterized protein n=1 Tax=Catenaria anguillulae PL171 TaxID=765915 RepID=A0A1Y2HWK7_9FUNG|nr:hypothetical protein BCR44DRAFT_311306 [Catenaria anguillulae PL171]
MKVVLDLPARAGASHVVTRVAAFAGGLIQDAMFSLMHYCRDHDATRIFSMIEWFNSSDPVSRLDRFPLATSLACRSVFLDLLEKVDVPAAQAAEAGDGDRDDLCFEVIEYVARNPGDLGHVLGLMDKHQLMTDDGWARLLAKGYAQPDTCAEFVHVVEGMCQDDPNRLQTLLVVAIHDQLSLGTNFDVVATLIGRAHALGGDTLNLILGSIMLWYPEDIPELLWLRPFNIPWSDPATLARVLDVYLNPSFALPLAHPSRQLISPVWLRNLCAFVRAVFGRCIGRRPAAESPPEWLAAMPRARLARLLLACHLLHDVHRTQVPHAKGLQLPSLAQAVDVLVRMWQQPVTTQPPEEHTCIGLVHVLPHSFLLALTLVTENIRVNFDNVSPRKRIVYDRFVKRLARVDHSFVLAMTCAPSSVPDFGSLPMAFHRHLQSDSELLLCTAIEGMRAALQHNSGARGNVQEVLDAVLELQDYCALVLELGKRRLVAVGLAWMQTSALLDDTFLERFDAQ